MTKLGTMEVLNLCNGVCFACPFRSERRIGHSECIVIIREKKIWIEKICIKEVSERVCAQVCKCFQGLI